MAEGAKPASKAEEAKPAPKPVLKKPPGYRDPAGPPPVAARPPPPRRQPLPPAFRQPGKPLPRPRHRRGRGGGRSCGRRICCWAFASALILAAVAAAAAGLAYLWFQPRLPSFRLESLNATALRVAARPDGTFLDAATKVGILVSNPNGKIALEYGDGQARVAVADADGDVDVGVAAIPRFEQGRKNWTVVRAVAAAKGVAVDDVAARRIRAGYRSKEVRFGVEVRTRVGLKVGGMTTAKVPIRVGCGPVSLKQGVSGWSLPKCRFYLFRWFNLY